MTQHVKGFPRHKQPLNMHITAPRLALVSDCTNYCRAVQPDPWIVMSPLMFNIALVSRYVVACSAFSYWFYTATANPCVLHDINLFCIMIWTLIYKWLGNRWYWDVLGDCLCDQYIISTLTYHHSVCVKHNYHVHFTILSKILLAIYKETFILSSLRSA